MLLWVILVVAVAIVFYIIIVFNRLVRTRQMANEAWSGIDVQLKRRSELVPNLVETAEGLCRARTLGAGKRHAVARCRECPAGKRHRRPGASGRSLVASLGKLVALAENYPDLKASANFLDLQQQLSQLETELQMARRYYNGAVRNQNVLAQSFPSNLIAGLFRLRARRVFRDLGCRRSQCAPGQPAAVPRPRNEGEDIIAHATARAIGQRLRYRDLPPPRPLAFWRGLPHLRSRSSRLSIPKPALPEMAT